MKVIQSCPTLCDPMDYTVHGILQARILQWVSFSLSRWSSQPRDQTQVSCIADRLFISWATREAQDTGVGSLSLLQLIFPTQESNHSLLHCRQIFYQLSYQGSHIYVCVCVCVCVCVYFITYVFSCKYAYMYVYMHACVLSLQLCLTFCNPMDCSPSGFSRQKYWSGLPCPPPGDLPNPGMEPVSPAYNVLNEGEFFIHWATGEAHVYMHIYAIYMLYM